MPTKGTPKATRAVVAKRRADAIGLRQAGVDLVTIGQQLHYGRWSKDGSTEGEDGKPDYGELLSPEASVARMVRQDIDRGLADRRKYLSDNAGEYVQQSIERLERLRAAAWPRALGGSIGHIRECARIEAQLALLLGLNKPVRHALELPEAQRQIEEATRELVNLVVVPPPKPAADTPAEEA